MDGDDTDETEEEDESPAGCKAETEESPAKKKRAFEDAEDEDPKLEPGTKATERDSREESDSSVADDAEVRDGADSPDDPALNLAKEDRDRE